MKDEGREMTVVDCKKLTWSEHCFPHISPPPYFNHRDTFLCRGLSIDLQMSKCKLGSAKHIRSRKATKYKLSGRLCKSTTDLSLCAIV